MIYKILYVYSIKCFEIGSGEKGAPLKWTSQECHRVVLPWTQGGILKLILWRVRKKLVPEDYLCSESRGAGAHRGIWVMLWRQCNSMSLRSTADHSESHVCRWEPTVYVWFYIGRLWHYGNIAKVVCAAESQLSTFDFISVDCDLCGRSFIIWQRNSVALMPTVIWVCAVIAT